MATTEAPAQPAAAPAGILCTPDGAADILTAVSQRHFVQLRIEGHEVSIIDARARRMHDLESPRAIPGRTCGGCSKKADDRAVGPVDMDHHQESPLARYARRLGQCASCPVRRRFFFVHFCGRPGLPHWRPLRSIVGPRRAEGCGCILAIKLRLPSSACPKGRWD